MDCSVGFVNSVTDRGSIAVLDDLVVGLVAAHGSHEHGNHKSLQYKNNELLTIVNHIRKNLRISHI